MVLGRAFVAFGVLLLAVGLFLGTRRVEEHTGLKVDDCGTIFWPGCDVTRVAGGRVIATDLLTFGGFAALTAGLTRWVSALRGDPWRVSDIVMLVAAPVLAFGFLITLPTYWIIISNTFSAHD